MLSYDGIIKNIYMYMKKRKLGFLKIYGASSRQLFEEHVLCFEIDLGIGIYYAMSRSYVPLHMTNNDLILRGNTNL